MASEFSAAQVIRYLKYIELPAPYASYIDHPEDFPKTKEALKALFRCQITRFPYDNLTLHYTDTKIVDIQPRSIYEKFMGPEGTQPSGRGGYCLECSIFFNHVLRGLGFSVYMTGVRNRSRVNGIPQGESRGWTHIVNIVQLPTGEQYHADVAFGGDGPTQPLQLISGYTIQNLGPQEVRLVHGNIPKQSRHEQKLWIYQYRNGADREWNTFYSFGEFEFFQDDFEVMNHYTSWEAVEKGNYWIVRFLRGGEIGGLPLLEGEVPDVQSVDGEVTIAGKIMYVNGVVKLNMGGKSRVIDTAETVSEKMAALHRWFNFSF